MKARKMNAWKATLSGLLIAAATTAWCAVDENLPWKFDGDTTRTGVSVGPAVNDGVFDTISVFSMLSAPGNLLTTPWGLLLFFK